MFRDHVALQGLVVAEEAATAPRDRPDLVDLRDRQGLPVHLVRHRPVTPVTFCT